MKMVLLDLQASSRQDRLLIYLLLINCEKSERHLLCVGFKPRTLSYFGVNLYKGYVLRTLLIARTRETRGAEFFARTKITSCSTYPYGEIKAYEYLNLNLPVYSSRPI